MILQDAVKISYLVNDSVYDSIYHVIAIKYDMEFVTLDATYFNKSKQLGNITLLN